jgi:hypothetical protein
MSFHDKKGKFSSAASAHSVSKGGERFKVIRQHRRIGPSKKKSPRQVAEEAIQRANVARQKAALTGALTGPGWITIEQVFEGK